MQSPHPNKTILNFFCFFKFSRLFNFCVWLSNLGVLSVLGFLADERDKIRESVVTVLLVFAGRVRTTVAATTVTAVLRRHHQSLIVTVVTGRGQRHHRTVLQTCDQSTVPKCPEIKQIAPIPAKKKKMKNKSSTSFSIISSKQTKINVF
jgi:hypothetical protein